MRAVLKVYHITISNKTKIIIFLLLNKVYITTFSVIYILICV